MPDCLHCGEPLWPDESQRQYANGPVAHLECFMRQFIGSVAHLEKRCSCYIPGSKEGDPEGLSQRQAAEAALALFQQQQEDGGMSDA
jgi:hypothetical protein